jgi:hypothetical protein
MKIIDKTSMKTFKYWKKIFFFKNEYTEKLRYGEIINESEFLFIKNRKAKMKNNCYPSKRKY